MDSRCTPNGLKRVVVGSRVRIVRLLMALVGAGSLLGCHKSAADKAEDASVKQSLDGLESQLGELETRFSDLRKQVEAVPANLPGRSELRGRFYAIEEGRGITDEKVKMLSGRFDSALSSGKRAELRQISKEIAETHGELDQLDQLHIALLHQVMALQRMAMREKSKQ